MPGRWQYLGLEWYGEDLSVEQFVSKFPVEAFDIAILPRAPWFDKQGRHLESSQPLTDGSGHELRAVIRPDVSRYAVSEHQPGQRPELVPGCLFASYLDCQTRAGVFIHTRMPERQCLPSVPLRRLKPLVCSAASAEPGPEPDTLP